MLDLLVRWVLHYLSARGRLKAFLVEQPPWMGVRVAAGYSAAVTYTFGLDTSPHRTQRRLIGADP